MRHRFALASALFMIACATLALPASTRASTGPYLVRDSSLGGPTNAGGFTEMNGIVYFTAKGGAKGYELWRTDGTSGGTWRVKDINPGSGSSFPFGYIAVGNRLYFDADDGVHGAELWISDGTAAGTRMVKDLTVGNGGYGPGGFTAYNGIVYFDAGDPNSGHSNVWRTDGTAAGTWVVFGPEYGAFDFTSFAGRLYFVVWDNAQLGTLYQSNGTRAGTKPVRDRLGHRVSGEFYDLKVIGSRLYFTIYGGEYPDFHAQVWRTTGTSAGTRRLLDLVGSDIDGYTDLGGTAFFTVADLTLTTNSGHLWKTGGTVATTKLVRDFPGDDPSIEGVAGGTVILQLWNNDQPTLWASDGTADGTQPYFGPIQPYDTVTLGGTLYFTASEFDSNDCQWEEECLSLWRSDGTTQGTYRVGGPFVEAQSLAAVGNSIYFTDFAKGQLWRFVP